MKYSNSIRGNFALHVSQINHCWRSIVFIFRVWKAVRKSNPRLRVHISTEGKHKNELMFQQRAPVKSVVYDTPYHKVNIEKTD